jgi:hypothetical protein
MNTNDSKDFGDQEINLTSISKLFSGFFQTLSRSIFHVMQFILKHIKVFIVLIALGLGLGIYLDKTQKTYNNCIIVNPNYDSTDYLYSKIDLLHSKIEDNDSVFFRSIGIKDPSVLASIEIHPIIDVFKFISSTSTKDNDHNYLLLKLMAEDGDIKKIVNDRITSKNYAFHQIHFITKSFTNRKEIIEPLLNYLENSQHYYNLRQVYIDNINRKIEANNKMILQIDELLNTFTSANLESTKNNKSVYINENTQVNDIIQTKDNLVKEIGYLKLDLKNKDKVIKEKSSISNLHNTRTIDTKLRVVFPVLFILMYLLIFGLVKFYKKQASLEAQEAL